MWGVPEGSLEPQGGASGPHGSMGFADSIPPPGNRGD